MYFALYRFMSSYLPSCVITWVTGLSNSLGASPCPYYDSNYLMTNLPFTSVPQVRGWLADAVAGSGGEYNYLSHLAGVTFPSSYVGCVIFSSSLVRLIISWAKGRRCCGGAGMTRQSRYSALVRRHTHWTVGRCASRCCVGGGLSVDCLMINWLFTFKKKKKKS